MTLFSTFRDGMLAPFYARSTPLSCLNNAGIGWLTAVLNARQSSRLRGFLPGGIVRVILGWAGRRVATRTDWKRPSGSIHRKEVGATK
jgi:hypothetical protein